MSWLNEEATARRKDLLVPYLVLVLGVSGGFMLERRQATLRDESVRRDQQLADRALAQTVYASDLAAYADCVVRAETVAAAKLSSDGIYDSLASLADRFGAPDIVAAVREEKGRFDAGFKVPDPALCVKPSPPLELTG